MAVIMASAAHTRDRLDRIRDSDGPGKPTLLARKGKPTTRRCQHGQLRLKCELCDRDRKIEVLEELCHRQSEILTGVAIALRGEPAQSTVWAHHDLVERAQFVMSEIQDLRDEMAIRGSSLPAPWLRPAPGTTNRRIPTHASWVTRLTRTLDRPTD
jgi:hypothetical protein